MAKLQTLTLQTLLEEDEIDYFANSVYDSLEDSRTMSHASSTATIVHLSDDDTASRIGESTVGRLSCCIFDFRYPEKCCKILEENPDRPDLEGAFIYALDFYTTKHPIYRWIYERVIELPNDPSQRYVEKSSASFIIRAFRAHRGLVNNAHRSSCVPH